MFHLIMSYYFLLFLVCILIHLHIFRFIIYSLFHTLFMVYFNSIEVVVFVFLRLFHLCIFIHKLMFIIFFYDFSMQEATKFLLRMSNTDDFKQIISFVFFISHNKQMSIPKTFHYINK